MTDIYTKAYKDGDEYKLEVRWYDWVMRRDNGVEGAMTKARVEDLIKELQELVK